MATKGPVWGDASDELNATILEWPPGDGPGATVSQLDVVYAVLVGSILLNGEPEGARYLTAHRRRGPLQIS